MMPKTKKTLFYLAVAFFIFALSIYKFTGFDMHINTFMQSIQNSFLSMFMLTITNVAGTISLFFLTLFLLGLLIHKKRWYHSALLVLAMALGLVLKIFIKLLVHRTRPQNSIIDVSGFSFPSGHATMSIIFFTLLIYSFKDDINNSLRKNLLIAISIFFVILIGLSRIYLNVHWASDVLAGFGLGLFSVLVVDMSINYLNVKYLKQRFR